MTSFQSESDLKSGVSNIKKEKKIEIPLEYAKNIYKVLENHVSMGFEIVSQEVKDMVSDDAYKKLTDIFYKYHNANCGPFNRKLKELIEQTEVPNSSQG